MRKRYFEHRDSYSDTPQLLLERHLKELRLPTMLREYDHIARQCVVSWAGVPAAPISRAVNLKIISTFLFFCVFHLTTCRFRGETSTSSGTVSLPVSTSRSAPSLLRLAICELLRRGRGR